MSFRKNDVQQISMFDSFNTLTPREQKALENSWAKVFAEEKNVTLITTDLPGKDVASIYAQNALLTAIS